MERSKGGHGCSSLLHILSWTVVVQSRGLANCQFLFIIFTRSFPLLPLLACPCCSLSLSLHLFFSICVSSLIAHYCLVSLSLCFPPYLLPVWSRWGLWDADAGTPGLLRSPAQCITPTSDALSRSQISHQSFCSIHLPSLACCCCCCWCSLSYLTSDSCLNPLRRLLLLFCGVVVMFNFLLLLHPGLRFQFSRFFITCNFSVRWSLPSFVSHTVQTEAPSFS